MKNLIILITLILGIFLITGCKNATNLQNDWQSNPRAINASARFGELPQFMHTYSINDPSVLPTINIETDTGDLNSCSYILIRHNGNVIYTATCKNHGALIYYGYYSKDHFVLMAYIPNNAPGWANSNDWKFFVDGNQEIQFNTLLQYPIEPSKNSDFGRETKLGTDNPQPPHMLLKEVGLPEIKNDDGTLIMYWRIGGWLIPYCGSYWTTLNPETSQIQQFGVDAWHLTE